jgi:hypothetical protein
VVSQAAVPVAQLGVTTTAVRFGQTLGGAFGAAVFGTVLARVYAAKAPAGARLNVEPVAIGAFVSAVDVVFVLAAAVLALTFVLALSLRVPR